MERSPAGTLEKRQVGRIATLADNVHRSQRRKPTRAEDASVYGKAVDAQVRFEITLGPVAWCKMASEPTTEKSTKVSRYEHNSDANFVKNLLTKHSAMLTEKVHNCGNKLRLS